MTFFPSQLVTIFVITTFITLNTKTNGQVNRQIIVPISTGRDGPKLFRIVPVVKTGQSEPNSPSVQLILPQNIPVTETNFSVDLGLAKDEIVQITNKKPDLVINSNSIQSSSLPVSNSLSESSGLPLPQGILNESTIKDPLKVDLSSKKLKKKRKPKKNKIKSQFRSNFTSINNAVETTTSVAIQSLMGKEKIDVNKCIDNCDQLGPVSSAEDQLDRNTQKGNSTEAPLVPLVEYDEPINEQMSLTNSTQVPLNETETATQVDLSQDDEDEFEGEEIKSNSDLELDNLLEAEVEVVPVTLIVDANLMIDLGAKMLYEALDRKSIPEQFEESKNKTFAVFDSLKSLLPAIPESDFALPSFDLPWSNPSISNGRLPNFQLPFNFPLAMNERPVHSETSVVKPKSKSERSNSPKAKNDPKKAEKKQSLPLNLPFKMPKLPVLKSLQLSNPFKSKNG